MFLSKTNGADGTRLYVASYTAFGTAAFPSSEDYQTFLKQFVKYLCFRGIITEYMYNALGTALLNTCRRLSSEQADELLSDAEYVLDSLHKLVSSGSYIGDAAFDRLTEDQQDSLIHFFTILSDPAYEAVALRKVAKWISDNVPGRIRPEQIPEMVMHVAND